MKKNINEILFILVFFVCSASPNEDDNCYIESTRENGKCVIFNDCLDAKRLLETGRKPQICGFDGKVPIVCCPLNTSAIIDRNPEIRKSVQKCRSYFPRVFSENTDYSTSFVGGTYSKPAEFPHMSILGYGDYGAIDWLCGGVLISEQFVLTAAHCIRSKEFGPVKWLRLGDLNIRSNTDKAEPQNFSVIETFTYPEFKPPSHYHDIAVLKLDRRAVFGAYVKPACLYTEQTLSDPDALLTAMGWGKIDYLGDTSDHLISGDLKYVTNDMCRRSYESTSKRNLPKGILDEVQICAGDVGKDTCQGDSGGPLQLKVYNAINPVYIVGITSFGKACGISNSPGVYTRVSHYLDWIENIVWPN